MTPDAIVDRLILTVLVVVTVLLARCVTEMNTLGWVITGELIWFVGLALIITWLS